MYKINTLDIKFFKFFLDTDPLEFENKNILIYGENGSGKSTVYWSLYTLLQSSFKDDIKIKEYFTQSMQENENEKSLVNIHEDDDEKSFVKISLQKPHADNKNFTISKNTIDTNKEDKIIANANLASDFINYKYLFRFFNFLHKEHIDLFSLFEYEIFHILDKDGVNLGNLWNEILELNKHKPRKIVEKTDYINLTSKLALFNSLLRSKVEDINLPTNTYLIKFNFKDIKIKVEIINGKYDKQVLLKPKIKLVISVKKNNGDIIPVHKPQSYFNEAKLTAIALSVRLAISQIKLKDSELKILVLDDLLVSLDMSNRDTVLNILLNDDNFKNFQFIILTHDKAFFQMAKNKFDTIQRNKWKYFEMYVNDSANIEKPLIIPHEDYFIKAEYHLVKHDYPACANYLRKEAERLLKYINQNHLTDILFNEDEEFTNFKAMLTQATADNNIGKYKEILDAIEILIEKREFKDFIDDGFNDNPKKDEILVFIRNELKIFQNFKKKKIQDLKQTLETLDEFTRLLLNPLSHDTMKVPIYKQELINTIEILKKLHKDLHGEE